MLDRVAGELAWGAQVCADIEDALSGLINASTDMPLASTARIQRLDELRQTLEDLSRLQQQLAHLAEGRDGVRMAVDSTIRQESLRRRLSLRGHATGASLAPLPLGEETKRPAENQPGRASPAGTTLSPPESDNGDITWL